MNELVVNLEEPDSIRHAVEVLADQLAIQLSKLDGAHAQVAHANEALLRVQDEVHRVERTYESVVGLARALDVDLGLETAVGEQEVLEPPVQDDASSKERAFQLVATINGPTNVAEVAEHMQGFSRKTVSWALWTLANQGLIQKIGHGRYAPLGWKEGVPSTNYLTAPDDFPRPPAVTLQGAIADQRRLTEPDWADRQSSEGHEAA